MPFSTPIFLFAFLPLVLALQVVLPTRLRNVALLLASLVFYAWGEPRAVLAMLASIAVNYGLGRAIGALRREVGMVAEFVVPHEEEHEDE